MGTTAPIPPPTASAVAKAEAVTEAERIARYVQRVVATAPPLTEQQRSRLMDLL